MLPPAPGETRPRRALSGKPFLHDVCVIGGGGHVGLPLALIFADSRACDRRSTTSTARRSRQVRSGADAVLRGRRPRRCSTRVLAAGRLDVARPRRARSPTAEFLVMIIGTPVDEHLNPTFRAIDQRARRRALPYLRDGQMLILRSTVFPGTSRAHPAVPRRAPRARRPRRLLPGAGGAGAQPEGVPRRCRRSSPRFDRATPSSGVAALFGRFAARVRRDGADGGRAAASCSPTPGATSSSPPSTSST